MLEYNPESRAVWRLGGHPDFYNRPLLVAYDLELDQHFLLARKKLTDVVPPHRNMAYFALDLEKSTCVFYSLSLEQAKVFMKLDQHLERLFNEMNDGLTAYQMSSAMYLRHVLDHGLYLLADQANPGEGTYDDPIPLEKVDEDLENALKNTRNLQFHIGVVFEDAIGDGLRGVDEATSQTEILPLRLDEDDEKACKQTHQRLVEIAAASDTIDDEVLTNIDKGAWLGKDRLKQITLSLIVRDKIMKDLLGALGQRAGWTTGEKDFSLEKATPGIRGRPKRGRGTEGSSDQTDNRPRKLPCTTQPSHRGAVNAARDPPLSGQCSTRP